MSANTPTSAKPLNLLWLKFKTRSFGKFHRGSYHSRDYKGAHVEEKEFKRINWLALNHAALKQQRRRIDISTSCF